jgi:predicted nucleic acid-binding Zn ribbon protein
MKPESIKDVLDKIFPEIKTRKDRGILEIWGQIAGKQTARHTKPAAFKEGILVVNVDSAIWLYELNLRKPILLQRLKKDGLRQPLKELRFRIGTIS